jgi:hypothetical protein
MSLIFATQLTAVATAALAALAIVTAWYARRAFLKQSQEVQAIEQQVKDQEGVTRQQARLLEVQSAQLDLQRRQFDEQREAIEDQIQANARQAEVLELQAAELRESLDERKQEAERRMSAQAARIFISQTNESRLDSGVLPYVLDASDAFSERKADALFARVTVVNTSDQPIYDAELRWHRGSASHGDPNPEPLGTIMPGAQAEHLRVFPLDTNMAVSGAVLRFRDAAGVIWMRRPDGGLTEQQ